MNLTFQMHANIVLSQDVLDYAPLFGEIADAYYEREMYAQAKPIYEILGHDAGVCIGRSSCFGGLVADALVDQQFVRPHPSGSVLSYAGGAARSGRGL